MKNFELNLDNNEILAYLGYDGQQLDGDFWDVVEEVKKEVLLVCNKRYRYSIHEISFMDVGVSLKDTKLILIGDGIMEHLINSKACIVMAATIGNDVEKLIKKYSYTDKTKSLIADACATVAIEDLCDKVEYMLRGMLYVSKEDLTPRFSPGYGDFPLQTQPHILNLLDASKQMGLTCTKDNIMIPRKSVTAVMGIVAENTYIKKKSCYGCDNYYTCKFRKNGRSCM